MRHVFYCKLKKKWAFIALKNLFCLVLIMVRLNCVSRYVLGKTQGGTWILYIEFYVKFQKWLFLRQLKIVLSGTNYKIFDFWNIVLAKNIQKKILK
jgi:hypothetical protein